VPELQRLRADHAPAVLAFELANRAYFATYISDRGDEYFDRFAELHSALLDDQEASRGAYHVLVAEDGSVLGRFNLFFSGNESANLGYRVAQHVAGHGVATATVRELCGLAATRYGLRTLKAAVSDTNVASAKVLAKAGFAPAGPADPAGLGGKQGTWYQRDLEQPLSGSLLVRTQRGSLVTMR
jgi:[ribosomal protein S5]-alanine N-acetyltransferase